MAAIDNPRAVDVWVICRQAGDAPFLLMLTFVQHLVDVLQICLALLAQRATTIETNLALAVISESQIVVWVVIWLRRWEVLAEVLVLWGDADTGLELYGALDLGGLGRNIWQLQILESLGAERHTIINRTSRDFVVIYHSFLPISNDRARLRCKVKSLGRQV
jgi:hypothetical protein